MMNCPDKETDEESSPAEVQYAQEVEALFRVGLAITSELTMKQVLQAILDECRRVLPVDTLYVALHDVASDSYETPLFFDLGKFRSLERVYRQTTRSLAFDVIASQRPLYVPDVRDPASMGEHVALPVADMPTVTYLGAPMMMRGRVVGVLSIQSLRADAYCLAQIRFLEMIAMQAAVAVENARLYEAARQELAERIRAEDQLRTMVTKYAALVDASPVGILITDDRGAVLERNPEAEHILQVAVPERLNRLTYNLPGQVVRPDGTPMPDIEFARVRALAEQRRINGVEAGIVQSDGVTRWFSVSAAPIPLEGYGVVVTYADITEQRRLAEKLRQSEQRYRLLADNMSDVVWARDLQGMLIYISPSFERVLGCRLDDNEHPHVGRMLSAQTMEAARERAIRLTHTARERRPVPTERFDLLIQRPDGSSVVLDVLVSPLVDEAEKAVGFCFAGRDVTEARALSAEIRSLNASIEQRVEERTEELAAALSQLQRVDRMNEAFLSAIGHERYTPLTDALDTNDVLPLQVIDPLNEHQHRQVALVQESANRLLEMVNDLLNYATLTAGKVTLWHGSCAVADICEVSIGSIRAAAARKQQEVTCTITPHDLVILSDFRATKNMLGVLLDNAVKFTPEYGHIALEVSHAGADVVQFVVSDDGIGITPEVQASIFQPFAQAAERESGRNQVVGFGLAYVTRMATTLGGALHLESAPGAGSRFILTLPVHL